MSGLRLRRTVKALGLMCMVNGVGLGLRLWSLLWLRGKVNCLGLALWSGFTISCMVNGLDLGLGLCSGLSLRRIAHGLGLGLGLRCGLRLSVMVCP